MKQKILIVDDDTDLVSVLTALFEDAGYAVYPATDSLRVYDRVKEVRPDIVLLDVMMPYLDGWDELKLFKLDDDLRGLPVIIMTADRLAFQGVNNPAQYGVVDRIFKPFALDELLQKVEAALKSLANSRP